MAEVIDPEVFVIGGGIAGAGEIILRIVHKYYRPDVLPAGADIPFELARLGNDAGMYGSMKPCWTPQTKNNCRISEAGMEDVL